MNNKIILDMGGGDNQKHVFEMIDKLASLNINRNDVFLKWQLFKDIKGLKSITADDLESYFKYAREKEFEISVSVFDEESIKLAAELFNKIEYRPPFIKIACRPQLYPLIYKIDPTIPIIVSVPDVNWLELLPLQFKEYNIKFLMCIAKYPAHEQDYLNKFYIQAHVGISDHCENLELFQRYSPIWYERHIIYQHGETTDPYGDSFASTIEECSEVFGWNEKQ